MASVELKERLAQIEKKLRITKVVATRAVKSPRGDTFAGFSAAWESVQEDGGGMGSSLTELVSDAEIASQGMTLAEAEIAHLLVARQAEIAAWRAAVAGGNVTAKVFQDQVAAIRSNYGKLIQAILQGDSE